MCSFTAAIASIIIVFAHRKVSKDKTVILWDIGLVAHALLFFRLGVIL
jgi:hypothetical protein